MKSQFKAFVEGDADSLESGISFSVLSHVLVFSKSEDKYFAVRYDGHNGDVFHTEQSAENAIAQYKKINYNARFDKTLISELS